MQDDLAALKKGQPPAGFKIEKETEKEAEIIPQVISPKITPPPVSHVELGKPEKAKLMPIEAQKGVGTQKIPPSPLPSLSKPTINIPPVGGLLGRLRGRPDFKRIVFYVITGLAGFVITAFLVPYFASLPIVSVSPTPSRTTTVTPASIENFFSIVDSVGISFNPDSDFTTLFIDSVTKDFLLTSREPGIYRITSIDGTKRYGFSEFLGGVSVTVPDELKSLADDSNLWLTLTYKSDDTFSFGFVVKLLNPNMADEAITALQNWESVITQALANLFKLDSTKAATVGFLDNIYNGTAIRYRNFPDPNLTIDFSVIQTKNGESYLIMVNSREHIYKIIDKLK